MNNDILKLDTLKNVRQNAQNENWKRKKEKTFELWWWGMEDVEENEIIKWKRVCTNLLECNKSWSA